MTRALLMSLTRHAAVAGEKEKRAVLYTYCILLVGPHCLGSVRESTYQPQQQLTCNINGDFSFPRMSFAIKTTFKGAATIHSFIHRRHHRARELNINSVRIISAGQKEEFILFPRYVHSLYPPLSLCLSAHSLRILPHHIIHSKERRAIISASLPRPCRNQG